jgi:hypothetical protein
VNQVIPFARDVEATDLSVASCLVFNCQREISPSEVDSHELMQNVTVAKLIAIFLEKNASNFIGVH